MVVAMNDASPTCETLSYTAPRSAFIGSPRAAIASSNNQTQQLAPELLADLECPQDVRVAPSGKFAVYSLRPASRRGDREISSLWIADLGNKHSARQFTSGIFNDELPQWSPDSTTIAFVSDRAKPGQSSAIYLLSLMSSEPIQVTDPKNEKKISSFKLSPDGRYIAFLSPDEVTAEQKSKHASGDDAIEYQAKWAYNRLRCADLGTRTSITLFNQASHVDNFTWNLQSDQIVSSALYFGVVLERVSLKTGNITRLSDFSGPIRDLAWFDSSIYFLGGLSPDKNNSVSMVYLVTESEQDSTPFAFGDYGDAVALRLTADSLAVQVQKGMEDQIWLIRESSATIVYRNNCEITTWDILDSGDGKVVVVLGKSFPNIPIEIYSIQDEHVSKLSQHGQAIANLSMADAQFFCATAEDNTPLDSVLLLPSKAGEKPWPTVVLPHGGPHTRVNFSFDVPYYHWGPWLAAAGYAVLCPNYRGGSARGEEFASCARGAVGTKDYSDIVAIVKEGVEQNLFDPDKIAIGGWSQGGFLSYLSVTRSNLHFRAAICGGGITDWEMLTMTSDIPAVEEELAGGAPWNTDIDTLKIRDASAVWHMKHIKTPILILHSEEDERVPVSQAVAFHRGCVYHKYECQMILYPRESHMVAERLHRIDMLKRIKEFYDLHME